MSFLLDEQIEYLFKVALPKMRMKRNDYETVAIEVNKTDLYKQNIIYYKRKIQFNIANRIKIKENNEKVRE